jgi:hypothetical protein
MFITVRKCYTFSTFTYAGTFALRSGNRDAMTGTYAGTQRAGDENAFGPFDGTLTITGGTGRLSHSTSGVLSFTAVAAPPALSAVNAAKVVGNAYYLVRGKMSGERD